MSIRREEVALEKRVQELEQEWAADRLFHITTRIVVYARSDDERDEPTVIRTQNDFNFLMDPVTGYRVHRGTVHRDDIAEFDELCEDAKHVHVDISCHEAQVDAILDMEHKVVGLTGGNRAGKTEVIAWRFFRHWCRDGGFNRRFWWVSPSREQTQIAVEKLCIGDPASDREAILPAELFVSYPRTYRVGDQIIRMIDGSLLQLFHGAFKGGNLKGYRVWHAYFDELAEIANIENWRIVKARTTGTGGTVSAATTPVSGHWARSEIVARAVASSDVLHAQLSIFDNPWQKLVEIWRNIETDGGKDDPTVRREYFGEWTTIGSALWPYWRPEQHLVMGEGISRVDQLGLPEGYEDITAQVAATHFKRRSDPVSKLLGQDFNVNPMTSVAIRVFGKPREPSTWGVFVYEEVKTRGTVQAHCDNLKKKGFSGASISCDSTGARIGTHASQGASGSRTNTLLMKKAGFDARACHYSNGKPVAPLQVDSLNVMHILMRSGHDGSAPPRFLVHYKCRDTILALDTQEAQPDGRIVKDPGGATDRLSSPTDALRYVIWSLFWKLLAKKKPKNEVAAA